MNIQLDATENRLARYLEFKNEKHFNPLTRLPISPTFIY